MRPAVRALDSFAGLIIVEGNNARADRTVMGWHVYLPNATLHSSRFPCNDVPKVRKKTAGQQVPGWWGVQLDV